MNDMACAQVLLRSTVGPQGQADRLLEVMAEAAAHCVDSALTGLALRDEGRLVLWLEGSHAMLRKLWPRLRTQGRLPAPECLVWRPQDQRWFPDWRVHAGAAAQPREGGQQPLAPCVSSALHGPTEGVIEAIQGLAFERALPAPCAMAQLLARASERELQAWSASVGALRPGWMALGLYLLGPVSRALGDAWVADHLQSSDLAIAQARLQTLLRDVGPRRTEGSTRSGCALLAALPGEPDAAELSCAAATLDAAGWQLRCAFPRAVHELVAQVREHSYDVVQLGLSDMFRREHRLADLSRAIRSVRQASSNPLVAVLVGGRAFVETPGLATLVGADSVGLGQGCSMRGLEAVLAWRHLCTWSPAMSLSQASLRQACDQVSKRCWQRADGTAGAARRGA